MQWKIWNRATKTQESLKIIIKCNTIIALVISKFRVYTKYFFANSRNYGQTFSLYTMFFELKSETYVILSSLAPVICTNLSFAPGLTRKSKYVHCQKIMLFTISQWCCNTLRLIFIYELMWNYLVLFTLNINCKVEISQYHRIKFLSLWNNHKIS